jgi:hypothetical protein
MAQTENPEDIAARLVVSLARQKRQLQELCGNVLATLRVNFMRGTIQTADNADFEKILRSWCDRFGAATDCLAFQIPAQYKPNIMNPNANPDTIAAAQRAMAQQTADTVASIEQQRTTKSPVQSAKDLERAFTGLENRGKPSILSATLTVREIVGADEESGKIVSLTHDDPNPNGFSGALEFFLPANHPSAALFVDGAQFSFELRAVDPAPSTLDAGKSGIGAGTEIPHGVLEKSPRPPVPGENIRDAADLAISNPPYVLPKDTSVSATTGTTGPRGSNDTAQRSSVAGGPAPANDNPNTTGPASDKQQPVKGEIVDGMQTGGDSGKGTTDGTREDSQFTRHHGADAKSEKADASKTDGGANK